MPSSVVECHTPAVRCEIAARVGHNSTVTESNLSGGPGVASGHGDVDDHAATVPPVPPVTVRSVAKDAGVSVATVSRVLSETGSVSDELRQRVLASAQKLRYRPNLLAKSLATGQSKQLGLVIPDLRNPYINDIIRGIDSACSVDGFSILVSDSLTDPRIEADLTDRLLRIVDALILVAPRQDAEALNRLQDAGKPVVSIMGPPGLALRNIGVDSYQGMIMLYDHLAGLGHRRAVYLGGPVGSSQDLLRRSAIAHAESLGMEVTVVEAGSDIDAGYRVTEEALTYEPTVITSYNDLLALGVFSRLGELGISIPEQISVTGFDGIVFTKFAFPPLTTIRTPRFELGAKAWDEARNLILDREPGEMVTMSGELIIGGSTGKPRRGKLGCV